MSGIVGSPGSKSGVIGSAGTIGYEEGAWTPSIGTSSSHGSNTIGLYSDVVGKYVKIGRVVRCNWSCRRNDSGTWSSGALYLRNLPFKSSTISNLIGSTWLDPGSGDGYKCFLYMPGSQNYALFSHGSTDSDASRYVTPPDTYWANGWYMNGALTYEVLLKS